MSVALRADAPGEILPSHDWRIGHTHPTVVLLSDSHGFAARDEAMGKAEAKAKTKTKETGRFELALLCWGLAYAARLT